MVNLRTAEDLEISKRLSTESMVFLAPRKGKSSHMGKAESPSQDWVGEGQHSRFECD
jgi:hypothetical protein